MADTKVSLMTALTGAGVATSDIMPIIDVSATTSGSKSITMAELYNYLATVLQPLDSDLTTIAGLTATTDNFIQSKSSAWASRTPTQVTADLIAMVGDSGSGGTKGLVPAPAAGDAAASKFLKADGTWTAVSATPGGSDTQIQFNDSSSFGGDSALTWNKTTNALTLAQGTITDPATPIAITSTWNDAADTFDAFTVAVTNTNSNSLSRLLSLSVGGTVQFKVTRTGYFGNPTFGWAPENSVGGAASNNGNWGFYREGESVPRAWIGTDGLGISQQNLIGWSSTNANARTIDTALWRDGAAGTIAQRNSTNAQTFRVYNTWTDASNGEWLEFGFATNVPYIKSTKNGTGTNRALILNSATGVINLDPNGASNFCFQVVTTNAYLNLWGKANGVMLGVDGTNYAYVDSSGITISSATQYQFGSSTNPGAGDDTGLGRAAAGIIKFTNGSTAGGGYATPAIAKTIASGAIAATGSYHVVDTESAAATDDLDTISGGNDGQHLVLSAANSSRDVVVKDGTGNLQLAGDCTLDNVQDTIMLIYNSTQSAWLELCRSNNGV